MFRALTKTSPLVLLTACGLFGGKDDVSTGDTAPACVVNEDINGVVGAGTPSESIGAQGLLLSVSAQIRIDGAGEVGSLDIVDAPSNVLQGIRIDVLPARDPIDLGLGGCTIVVPVTADNTSVLNAQGSDIWRAEVRALLADLDSNCSDPAYATIQEYAGGDVATFFASNIQITIGQPLTGPTDYLAAAQGDSIRDYVLGGTIQLNAQFNPIEMAVLVDTVDSCGVYDPDDTESLLADDVLASGPANGAYFFVNGPLFSTVTITPGT